MQVLLTASGIGQRLGDLTKYSNKSLVRIGKKPAISYIIESFPIETPFIITLGHFGDQVKQFLELAYPERSFTFVWIDKYVGSGSSLAYSILKAKDYITGPFIFHCCDTILNSALPALTSFDWMAGYKTNNSSQYVSLVVNSGQISKIKDKGELAYDYSYVGVAGIYHWREFFQCLEKAYSDNPNNDQLSDVIGLKGLLNEYPISCVDLPFWLDIGNADGLKFARENIKDRFEILDKLEESIFLFDDFVIKFFSNSEVCKNRVERAKLLNGLVPEILGSSGNFYKYKLAKGELLARCVNEDIFGNLLDWAKINLWKKLEENITLKCHDFYYEKTLQRVGKFYQQTDIVDEKTIINGIEVPRLQELLKEIDWERLCGAGGYQFHGDFILDNIIYEDGKFILLDWRQDFAGDLQLGDMYYDLAKLNHNTVFNHDLVNRNLFEIEIGKEIKCDILRSHILVGCQNVLFKFAQENKLDVWKIKILTCLIWLNMASLHHYPLNIFLYYFGKFNLFKELRGLG